MATPITKPITKTTEYSYTGIPLVVTLNPDLTLYIQVKGRPTTKMKIDVFRQYLDSGKPGNGKASSLSVNGKDIFPSRAGSKKVSDENPLQDLFG